MPSRQNLYNWMSRYPNFLYKYRHVLPLRGSNMLNSALETVEAIPCSATRMETRRAQMKAGFQLLASDRMEGKGPIETKSSRSGCDSLMENSNRLLVI
jgi:hypothetical protein